MTAAPRFAEYSHMESTFLQPCRVAQFKSFAPELRSNNSNGLARAEIRCRSPRMSQFGPLETCRLCRAMSALRGNPEDILLGLSSSQFDPKLKPSIPHRSALRKKRPFRKPLLDSFLTDDAITSSMTSLQKLEYRGSPSLASGWV
jgi:hypothetical protein